MNMGGGLWFGHVEFEVLVDHTQMCEPQGRGPGWKYMFGNHQHLTW